jgi:hypothetical protein
VLDSVEVRKLQNEEITENWRKIHSKDLDDVNL